MANKTTFQQKTRVLNKLFEHGINSEKELQSLSLEKILEIKGITIPEMAIITELQKQTKAGKLFSYLGGGVDESDNE
ncbi:MAG: hypothetical protein ACLUFN_02080 [Eubacterium sp.]